VAGSTAALICDTGALLDYLVGSAPDHRQFRSAIDQARTRYVPALVLNELDYFWNERRAMESFMRDLARGALTYAAPALDELSRAMDIDRRYSDLRLGLVDGSVIALAEGLGIRRLATRDVRHFAVRLRDGSAFELIVNPTDPDDPECSRNSASLQNTRVTLEVGEMSEWLFAVAASTFALPLVRFALRRTRSRYGATSRRTSQ